MVDPDDEATVRSRYGRSAGLGAQFGAVIIVFSLVGNWLDEQLGTRPLLLILGVLLGFAGGTISIVRAVSPGRDRADD